MTHEHSVEAPAHIDADFVFRCVGDSMINARIFDGDIVYIRQQETVENGEIAAVLVDDTVVVIGRIWNHTDSFLLQPENPAYASRLFFHGETNTQIIGKAVGFTSRIPASGAIA